jgi:hypothetical protein
MGMERRAGLGGVARDELLRIRVLTDQTCDELFPGIL